MIPLLPVLRLAVPEDGPALAEIYRPYVLETPITFDLDPPDGAEFARRIRNTLVRYPYLVACQGDRILGYAYASAFKNRAAYDWSVETSIYVRKDCHGQGVGSALYTALETALARQHVLRVNACITDPNPGSVAFHEKFGYRLCAHFHDSGFKLGRWWDVIWMEKTLGGPAVPPPPFVPFGELIHQKAR